MDIEVHLICGGTARYEIEVQCQAVGQQFEGIEVQNMEQKNSNISFEVQKITFEGYFEIKMIFKNILGDPALIPV